MSECVSRIIHTRSVRTAVFKRLLCILFHLQISDKHRTSCVFSASRSSVEAECAPLWVFSGGRRSPAASHTDVFGFLIVRSGGNSLNLSLFFYTLLFEAERIHPADSWAETEMCYNDLTNDFFRGQSVITEVFVTFKMGVFWIISKNFFQLFLCRYENDSFSLRFFFVFTLQNNLCCKHDETFFCSDLINYEPNVFSVTAAWCYASCQSADTHRKAPPEITRLTNVNVAPMILIQGIFICWYIPVEVWQDLQRLL